MTIATALLKTHIENRMTAYRACSIIEGFDVPDSHEEILEAWSFLIATELCWKLQGRFGRTARGIIESGLIDEFGNILEKEMV